MNIPKIPARPHRLAPHLGGAVLALASLFGGSASAAVEWSLGIQVPGLSIGINVPSYPQMAPVPGYPVYYAPGLRSNYFFYDGVYWVYQDDNWYASTWYDGPWGLAAPETVPLFVLRIPVRYYRSPPTYFRGWRPEAAPRWGDHWGPGWQAQRPNWDRWNRQAVPPAAPLPSYQRRYPAGRYPQPQEQQILHEQNYRYQPREPGRGQPQAPTRPQPAPRPQPQQPQQPPHGQPQPQQPPHAQPPQPQQPQQPPQRQEPPRGLPAPQAEPPQRQEPPRGQPREPVRKPEPGRERDPGPDRERDNGEGRGPGRK